MKRMSPLITICVLVVMTRGRASPPTLHDVIMTSFAVAHVSAQGSTSAAAATISDTVRVETGLISGTSGRSPEIRVFKGVPFAAAPVGELRWRTPQPAPRWDGVRKADQFGPRCMQGGGPNAPPTSEDCLFLNVWTGARSSSDRRPVMVWSYGGAFAVGSGSMPLYDGENLAKKGVIVVTYNYRLGPFGWFSHPELSKESGHNASGNQGLMDAIAALKWIQKNIPSFGGDPKNVTIFGESAGGTLSAATLVTGGQRIVPSRYFGEPLLDGLPDGSLDGVGRGRAIGPTGCDHVGRDVTGRASRENRRGTAERRTWSLPDR
jgi:para-nitrobenzyl esterase